MGPRSLRLEEKGEMWRGNLQLEGTAHLEEYVLMRRGGGKRGKICSILLLEDKLAVEEDQLIDSEPSQLLCLD